MSPGAREKTPTSRSRSGSLQGERQEPVKEAMSPSVAQCMRSVFAAFMWHEGIVHDAMACASFLKFHPNLIKEKSKDSAEKEHEPTTEKTNTTAASKKLARHSAIEIGNMNVNEAMKKLEQVKVKERHCSESKAETGKDTRDDVESDLPPTLQHLVYFWEDLFSGTIKVISQNLILPSPVLTSKVKKGEKKEKGEKGEKEKKSKKKKDLKYPAVARGNLFGEAAAGILFGVPGGGDRETMCELCLGLYPNPVTYHMRQAHPGCGRHAGGQGYNSGGNFCGGWAGNCGDGGIGGSTWYLMCDRCREKYLREKRQVLKEKTKKVKKKNTPVKQTPTVQPLEAHMVLKNNAMFLLDLASAAGLNLPTKSQTKGGGVLGRTEGGGVLGRTELPSVTENNLLESSPFPSTPFLYLCQHGAYNADSAFADDVIFSSGEMSSSGHFERSISQGEHLQYRASRSGSEGGKADMVSSLTLV